MGFEMLWELTANLAAVTLRQFRGDPQRNITGGGGFVSSTAHAERAGNRELRLSSHPRVHRESEDGVPLEVARPPLPYLLESYFRMHHIARKPSRTRSNSRKTDSASS